MVACGWRHTITVAESGNLYTFGWSKYGQLGHGNFQDHLVPHQVHALRNKKIRSVRVPCPIVHSSMYFSSFVQSGHYQTSIT
jgi:alpha-tubulin suppressor-like RCC1 family protein